MDAYMAALAGLLHDIGKFWQRSERQRVPPGYEACTKDHVGKNGTHAIWSRAFVDQYVPFKNIAESVLLHHNPQSDEARLVALADRLSASERQKDVDQAPQQLQSVFCQLGGKNLPPHYLPLHPLELRHEVLFASEQAQTGAQIQALYREMWTQFTDEVQRIAHETDLPTYIEALQVLMMRYTWCVPSAYYRSIPDISLYDHSRTTGALAAVLTSLDDPALIAKLLRQRDDTPIAALIEGDVSGVQKFIYAVRAKGAAKGLRARSLYLQFLSEAAARFILRQMEMPVTNMLYVGGGHFYLLVPSGKTNMLRDVRQTLDEMLLTHHDGDLYLALGYHELTAMDFNQPERFSAAWQEVGKATSEDKRRRYASLSPEKMAQQIFAPRPYTSATELGVRRLEREEDATLTSSMTDSFHQMGGDLHRADALLLVEIPPEQRPSGSYQDALAALGYVIQPVHATVDVHVPVCHRAVLLGMTAPVDDSLRTAIAEQLNCPVATGLRFTVNEIAQHSRHGVADFSEFQEAAQGLKRLGVLRMDVDNLGRLFSHGFIDPHGKPQATLSRVASLSFALSLYFEGWVGELCRQTNAETWRTLPESEHDVQPLYAVYSGGDDLFIVGTWDVIPDLAEAIHDDLTAFACGNPEVHVSGGITLHTGKYPLYQAAEDAESALDGAKAVDGKDAVTFLNQTVRWSNWERVTRARADLMRLHEQGVARSLFQMLLELHSEYKETRKALYATRTRDNTPQIVWGPWIWHSAYRLRRMADRYPAQAKALLALEDRLKADDFTGIEHVGIAARWADALTRTEHNERTD